MHNADCVPRHCSVGRHVTCQRRAWCLPAHAVNCDFCGNSDISLIFTFTFIIIYLFIYLTFIFGGMG